MKYRTEKAKELKAELNALIDEKEAENRRNNLIFYEYLEMEGKYGKKVSDKWDMMQGCRGYHFEYENDELREKEKAERKQFLKDNNFRNDIEVYEAYKERIAELENAFNLEQYGMTTEERKNAKEKAKLERRIAELEKELAEAKAELEALNN